MRYGGCWVESALSAGLYRNVLLELATTKGIERNPVIGDLAISIDWLLVQILAIYK